jgi:LysM repeat protein
LEYFYYLDGCLVSCRYNKPMGKLISLAFAGLLILMQSISLHPARAESLIIPRISTAYELIDAVNNLRTSYGLSPYSPNSILMDIAQKQAEYNLSIGTITHIGPNGLRPYQRALQAGYPVAGDINLGGFFSENITAGVGMSAAEAVEQWTGDDPHLNTMISSNLQDIGAGVSVSGNTFYYVIDCGRSTGGIPATFIPPPAYNTPISTKVPNTPNADGSVIYIVQPGDTALGIALAYGISLKDLLVLNGLTEKSVIYPRQKIIIRPIFTPTATFPPSTPTQHPTITLWVISTLTPTSTETSTLPMPIPVPGLPASTARNTVILIGFSALIIAALLVLIGSRHK